jgi:DNA polymerase III sliding clamp (beta) subunit (PCNA family)
LNITRGIEPPIVIESADGGLLLRVASPEAAVELQVPGDSQSEHMCAPFELLDACEAKNDGPVTLTLQDGNVVAQWTDGSVPQLVQFDQPESLDEFPALPTETAENPPEFLRALTNACTVTDPVPTRYALSCVQLDHDHGRIAASDGHQIFVQTGFPFPWDGAVLLPTSKVFACPHLPTNEPVTTGRTEEWLTMRIGPWTYHFRLNVDGRFPRVEECLPRDASATATLEIADSDAAFVLSNIRRLPKSDDFNEPVTLDLNGEVVVRAEGEDRQPVTELVLANSTRSGDVTRLNTNRGLFARALTLGFRQIRFIAPDQPAFCREENRTFVWAPLSPDNAIKATKNANRIESLSRSAAQAVTKATPTPRRTTTPMTEPQTNGNGQKADVPALATETDSTSPIEQAEALRDSLKEALDKTRELVRTLKRQKKTSRIVESTLASLRQLQTVDL